MKPEEKYPELMAMMQKLRSERKQIEEAAAPSRRVREQLVSQIQPLEEELRRVDAQIASIERPRLGEIDNQIAALARSMGGRAMSDSTK